MLTRAVIAHECTLAERSWRRQLSWPLCADHIKAMASLQRLDIRPGFVSDLYPPRWPKAFQHHKREQSLLNLVMTVPSCDVGRLWASEEGKGLIRNPV